MAKQTEKNYRNCVVYSIFVRNYSEQGTFDAVAGDLDRIRDLGVDVIWLLPVYPIGKVERKGSLGSPYAIQDYRKVNPEYGTLQDFRSLVEMIHTRGMKCIMDVVYNHTSPDSWLAQHHPDWFYHKVDGSLGSKGGEWHDVIDLDYSNTDLWNYQIETLMQWAEIVDGFRCDVASLIPLDFWLRAREKVEAVHPGCFWLSESVEPEFIKDLRLHGLTGLSDSEILQAFDVCYDYDIFSSFRGYLKGKNSLVAYIEKINQQEVIYPDNYIKLRYLENHDQARAKEIIPDEMALRNWTAFTYFQKGMTLLYAGQEVEDDHLPGLFDKDTVRWNSGKDLSLFMQKLYEIKKHPLFTDSCYEVRAFPQDVLYAVHRSGNRQMNGLFCVGGQTDGLIPVDVPDGVYPNLIDGENICVKGGSVACDGTPVIFESIREEIN
jgi:glycosidase